MKKQRLLQNAASRLLLPALGVMLIAGTAFSETESTVRSDPAAGDGAGIVYLNGAEEAVEQSALSGEEYIGVSDESGNYTVPLYNIESVTVEGVSDQPYTGSPVTLNLTVKMVDEYGQTHILTEGEEYTVSYANNVNPGTASVTIKGTEKVYHGPTYEIYYWTGTITRTFKITGQIPAKETTGAAIGTLVEAGSGASLADYRITGNDTAAYVKCKAARNAKNALVPPTVTINKAVYRVTGVEAGAFAGRKKITKLTIGANVESIGASAFGKCKKLKTLTVKTAKLTAAKCKKCLKGSSVATVKVPKAKKKAYKKVFKKSVCGKNVKIK